MSGVLVNRLNAIRWILGGSIILSCLGYTINTLRYTDKIFTFLWSEHYLNLSEEFALRVSEWGAFCMLFASLVGVTYRFRGFQVFVFLWILVSVICGYIVEIWHPAYIAGASATRLISPLLFLLFASVARMQQPGGMRLALLEWGMRISIAATFFYHGHECLAAKAQFLDYIQSFVRFFGVNGIPSASALAALKIIGLLDILLAISLLIPARLYLIVLWMAFWGLATGYVRVHFSGWQSYPDFLLRVIHGTLPLCLFLLWRGTQLIKKDFIPEKV